MIDRSVSTRRHKFPRGSVNSYATASHSLSSRAAVNMALCPGCEPCAGSPTFKHRRRVGHVRRHRHWRRAGGSARCTPLWMPPNQQRAGDIVLVDSTNVTTLFGGTESLQNFWKNFALMK